VIDPSKALGTLPPTLREELLKSYREIAANYSERRWEPAELNGGKFCEVVYSIVNGSLSGTFPAKSSKPNDIVTACRALESAPANPGRAGDRSLRILIPRVLLPLYEIRNNRGVGHVGGDVDPNFLDATAVYSIASWVLAELVRIFHNVSTNEAQDVVDALAERKHPLIWNTEGIKRILDPSMKAADQTLLLLHAERSWVSEDSLLNSIEYSNPAVFRQRVLKPLHDGRLIEHDKKGRRALISPKGSQEVETRILKTRSK
jgi:hypothetical protein